MSSMQWKEERLRGDGCVKSNKSDCASFNPPQADHFFQVQRVVLKLALLKIVFKSHMLEKLTELLVSHLHEKLKTSPAFIIK